MRLTSNARHVRALAWFASAWLLAGCADGITVSGGSAFNCADHALRLHPMFTDHLVLQREAATPVWGCAAPGEAITVALAGQTAHARADAEGRWLVRLDPIAAGGPHTLKIAGERSPSLTLTDVLVGDVWLCSGQSNMAWPVSQTPDADATAAEAAQLPHLRLLNAPGEPGALAPQRAFDPAFSVRWTAATEADVLRFSAVCAFTGLALQRALNIPLGLIATAVDGSPAEAWVSAEGLATMPDFKAEVDDVLAGKPPQGAGDLFVTGLYNRNIAPIVPYGLKGVMWYQGESNAGRGEQYRRLLPALIGDWRAHFERPELPFLVVQVHRYNPLQTLPIENGGLPEIREAQLLTSRDVPLVGLAVTLDSGVPDIHPIHKQDIAERLTRAARGLVYHEDVPYRGPVYRRMSIEGDRIRLEFDNVGQGLMVGQKTPLEPVKEVIGGAITSFVIAGADHDFVFAKAVIDGDTVLVSAPEVPDPAVVRYAWADNPAEPYLYNREGLPAVPFRTDARAP